MTTHILLDLGCGSRYEPVPDDTWRLVRLDQRMDVGADLVCVLGRDPIPLPDASVDRANASYLLDHLWHQCQPECAPPISWDMFWRDLHRVLKPGGYLTFVASLSSAPHNWRNCEALADLPGEWRLIPVASESYARGTVVAVPVAR